MAVQKKFALGRGLDALISTEEVKTAGSSSINEIELSKYPSTLTNRVVNLIRWRYRSWPTLLPKLVSSNPLRCVN